MKAYNLNGHPYFTNDDCLELPLIDERPSFTDDERNFGIIQNGALVVDTVRRDAALLTAEAERIRSIKQKANEIIVNLYPEWKQRNMIARGLVLERKERLTGLTQSEADEMAAIENIWSWVEGIRNESNLAEANGTLLKDIVWPI